MRGEERKPQSTSHVTHKYKAGYGVQESKRSGNRKEVTWEKTVRASFI